MEMDQMVQSDGGNVGKGLLQDYCVVSDDVVQYNFYKTNDCTSSGTGRGLVGSVMVITNLRKPW